MARQSPLIRQWILLRALCARGQGATVKELADELEVGEKTIYPYGLTYHRGSLYLVGQQVERGLSHVSSPGTDRRLVGRGQGEGNRGLSRFSGHRGKAVVGENGTVPLPPHIPSPTGRGQGEGNHVEENPTRHWKIDRIEAAKLEELRFNRPEDFDLQEHFARSFGVFHGDGEVHVKVRFSRTVARYVQESTWHASQRLTKETGGSMLAEFDLDGTEEIMRWILSFGRHAEVIEPEELREGIERELREVLEAIESREVPEARKSQR